MTALNDRPVEVTTCPTYTYVIHMAGDYDHARAVLRTLVSEMNYCAAISRAAYIYTGGEEAGFRVTCINYPRIPVDETRLRDIAFAIGDRLMRDLGQGSYTVEGPQESWFFSRRGDVKAVESANDAEMAKGARAVQVLFEAARREYLNEVGMSRSSPAWESLSQVEKDTYADRVISRCHAEIMKEVS